MWGFKIAEVQESGKWELNEKEEQKCKKWMDVEWDLGLDVTGEQYSVK